MITVHHLENSRSQRILWLLEELELEYEVKRYDRDKTTSLARSGAELVRAQAKSKETGHGSGRLAMARRIQRHGDWTIAIGEAISYGPYVAERGRDVIAQLIVDDGVPSRGHRKTLYDKDYRLAGVSCGPHPTFETVCVIDFAGGEKGR
jgi:uncharacterized protein YkwD